MTKIYDHYTYKQDKNIKTFKKEFVVMNQNARKTTKTKVKKDFYELLNNSNFGKNSLKVQCLIEDLYTREAQIKVVFDKIFANIRDEEQRNIFRKSISSFCDSYHMFIDSFQLSNCCYHKVRQRLL